MTTEQRIALLEKYVSKCIEKVHTLSNKVEPLLLKAEKLQHDVENIETHIRQPDGSSRVVDYTEELNSKIEKLALQMKEINSKFINAEITNRGE